MDVQNDPSQSTFSPDVKKLKLSDSPATHTHHTGIPPAIPDNVSATGTAATDAQSEIAKDKMAASGVKRALYATVTDPAGPGCSPPAWFQAFADRMEAKMDSVLDRLSGKILENEQKIHNLDFEVGKVKDEITQIKKENESLLNKLDDLENRSRRKNLVIFGINEGEDGKEDCNKTVKEFLSFVGAEQASMLIERAHRTPPTPRYPTSSAAGKKPRMIHIGFATYVAKEKVRKLCIEKLKHCEGLYKESKVYVAEDLSKRVLQLRKKRLPQLTRLKNEGRRPFFKYPDLLCYRDQISGKLITVPPVADPAPMDHADATE